MKYRNFSSIEIKDTDVRNVPDKDFLEIIFFVCLYVRGKAGWAHMLQHV